MNLDRSPFLFLGMVHLGPLPAGPRPSPGFAEVRRAALRDARALLDHGADGLILENFGDAPFPAGAVEPHVGALVAVLVAEIRAAYPSAVLGVNLLRNDARAALGVAAAAGADFIRVNVHVGAMLTDQGVLSGDAHGTLRYRQALGASVGIAADVLVKHAVPLGPVTIEEVARDTWRRGGADALIVTGAGTGRAADPGRVEAVRAAVPEARVWVGSGVDLASAADWRGRVHGAIVGTALHEEGEIGRAIDPGRVEGMARGLGR